MKTSKPPVERFITSPLFGVVFCAAGALGLWWVVSQPREAAPKPNAAAEQPANRRTAESVRPSPERRTTSSVTETDEASQGSQLSRARRPSSTETKNEEAPPARTRRTEFAQQNRANDRPSERARQPIVNSDESDKAEEPRVNSGNALAARPSEPRVPVTETKPPKLPRSDANGSRALVAKAPDEGMPKLEVAGAETGPEKLLASRGLHKVKTWYVIPTEYEIDKEFKKIRPTYNAMEFALRRVIAAKEQDVIVNTLEADQIATQTNINALQMQLGTLPNNLDGRAAAQEIRNQITQLNFHLNEVRGNLQIQRSLQVPPAQQQVFWGDFVETRNAFYAATKEIKPLFDQASAEYKQFENDTEVKEALRVISDRTRVRYALGPSKFLRAHKTDLMNGEKMVSFDPDAYRRKEKVKSVKQKKKP
jgi:hypothetical protein